MSKSQQIRLAIVAPSGTGKSTAAQAFQRAFDELGRRVEIVKLATPLYRIQSAFFSECGLSHSADVQHQSLLEAIATQMRRISPRSLAENFQRRLEQIEADVVINDDLRDDEVDWPHLSQQGFRVVRIVTGPEQRLQRLGLRGDPDVVLHSKLDLQIARIRADFVLTNSGPVTDLEYQVTALARRLLSDAERQLRAA